MERVESLGRSSLPRSGGRGSGPWADRYVFGTPARFMVPRLVFLGAVVLLTLFGITMIYSSSSISALTSSSSSYNPAFYLQRQVAFAGVGAGLAFLLAYFDYHLWLRKLLVVEWAVTLFLLLLVMTPFAGADAYGASRWIQLGPVNLQPSEFAKVTLVLVAANLISDYYQDGTRSTRELLWFLALGVLVPLGLIFLQPDKGTVTILGVTLVVMLYFGGASGRLCLGILGIGLAAMIAVSMATPYSRARVMTMLNPFSDPYGTGYQIVQGFYAFGSGGLFGVGIGMSKQKYSYLPMAYNDFIYAVIGEELGLVGTVGMLCAFAALLWAGLGDRPLRAGPRGPARGHGLHRGDRGADAAQRGGRAGALPAVRKAHPLRLVRRLVHHELAHAGGHRAVGVPPEQAAADGVRRPQERVQRHVRAPARGVVCGGAHAEERTLFSPVRRDGVRPDGASWQVALHGAGRRRASRRGAPAGPDEPGVPQEGARDARAGEWC